LTCNWEVTLADPLHREFGWRSASVLRHTFFSIGGFSR